MKYDVVGLYEHNEISYDKVKEAFKTSDVVGIVQATGTGKSYNALQLCYDNQDKKIIYVVPSLGIIEHIKSIIEENPNLSLERDFKNVEFRTYQSFLNLSKKEMESIPCDLIIDDEFHHLGAPVWGQRIKKFIELCPNVKVFGMTAYTVRDRGTIYERDMANPDTDELFSNKIVSRYDLCDAMVDKVLPKPIYKCAYIGLEKMLNEIKGKVNESNKEINELLESARKKVHEAPSIKDLVIKSIKKNGKYIYFCPPYSEKGANDIESIKNEALEWFKSILPEEDIVFYTSTSEMGTLGKKNRKAFYNDLDLEGKDAKGKLRVMFAINQYNEGIHAPNVDGVIMGRATTSDIVFFEQLGRALSVRGNTLEEYSHLINLSYEQLLQMCKDKDIPVKEDATKEDLIENLLAPIVIDLVGNYEYIKELENNLQNRVKEIQSKGPGNERVIKLKNPTFDIEIENKNLYEMLENLRERLTFSWNDMYEYAMKYYEHYGNLEVPSTFKTNDGYTFDEKGEINLGNWIKNQRYKLTPESDKGLLLSQIGMRFEKKYTSWKKMYEYAKKYYEHYGNLEVPVGFKTNDGFTQEENGKINLGTWIVYQRQNLSPNSEKGQLLSKIGMRFKIRRQINWKEMYEYAKKYYEHYGDLEVPVRFKTNDGFTPEEKGNINLGSWIIVQRQNLSPNSEKGQLLSKIGMCFENKRNILSWEEMYEYAKKYYEHYGDLEVPFKFKTNDGFTSEKKGNINLGSWIIVQRQYVSPNSEKGQLLSKIGMRFTNQRSNLSWEEMYEYAKKYYEHYGNLEVPKKFKTNDGFTKTETGKINLGYWIKNQRNRVFLKSEQRQLLSQIGMRFKNKNNTSSWEEMYEYAKKYYEHYGDLEVTYKFKTNDGYTFDETGKINLKSWISYQRKSVSPNSEKGQLLSQIGMRFENKISTASWEEMYEYAKKYYEHYGNLEVPFKFKTNDGYTFDETGKINLKNWISYQRQTVSPDSEKGQLLLQIGMRFENKNSTILWEEMYEYAKKYYEHYGNLEVPFKFKTNDGFKSNVNGIINLGRWISSQRQRVSPESEKGKLLSKIGMRFENKINTASWEEMYEYATKYYEHYGNLEVPSKFKTNDGFKSDDNGKINLGSWISSQRQRVSPDSEKGNLLSQIGMRFENKISTASWEEMYAYAKKYYEHYGNLEVSKKFKTNDGFTLDENGNVNLGNWIMYQRQNVSPDSEKGNLLLQIGMRFENIRSTLLWEEMYEYAKKYYEHYGNLEVPSKFKTTDGFKSDVNGKINLGRWISHQRQNVSPESEKGQLLSQIGMRFEKQRDIVSWNKMYEYAKKFYEHYGNLEVPFKFKTDNGFTPDVNGKINLGGWIIGQRRNLSSESEKGQLLSQIGMRFENKRDIVSWDKMYEYAKKFYEHYGKLQVPVDFRTDDGFTPNEKGKVNLGNWILEQRNSVDINSEQGLKLTSIGMIWDVKKHTRQLQIICIYNKINMEINKKILTHISVQELCAKIDFLKENNIPIVDNNGNLHEIFKLSNVNLKQKYNVSIESLISDYYLKNSKERSV